MIAAISNGAALRKGEASLHGWELVPAERTTVGKQRLVDISKRRSSYLRRLFMRRFTLKLLGL
jgi:hypothetical protein